jgi:hypothetical protein
VLLHPSLLSIRSKFWHSRTPEQINFQTEASLLYVQSSDNIALPGSPAVVRLQDELQRIQEISSTELKRKRDALKKVKSANLTALYMKMLDDQHGQYIKKAKKDKQKDPLPFMHWAAELGLRVGVSMLPNTFYRTREAVLLVLL